MQVEYFDLPLVGEQKVELPLPMRFLHFRYVQRHVRIYYILLPAAKEEIATFWLVRSDEELADTFPGKYLATVQNEKANPDVPGHDSALHLFIQTPGNGPRKPHVLNIPPKDTEKNGDNTT